MIPCLDEARTIGTVVRDTLTHVQRVLVVDDGSTDGTARVAGEAGAVVLKNPTSLGKGASLRRGWQHAGEMGAEWIVMLDGDGQHVPADMPHFFHRAAETGADLVVGNRMHQPSAMPWLRRRVNRWMSRRLSRAAGIELPDSQCGFRLARTNALREVTLQANHYEIESEQLLAFVQAGYKVEFVPISVIYRMERSKIHPLRDTVRWFRWLASWQRSASEQRASRACRRSR